MQIRLDGQLKRCLRDYSKALIETIDTEYKDSKQSWDNDDYMRGYRKSLKWMKEEIKKELQKYFDLGGSKAGDAIENVAGTQHTHGT